MVDKNKYSTSQLLNFTKDSYLERTSRPVYAIVFLLPFIVFYELGTLLLNTDLLNETQTRVVAFIWLQKSLESIGFGGKFTWVAPPLAVVVILITLQLSSRKRWRFRIGDTGPMAIECILLAVPLIVFSLLLNTSSVSQNDSNRFEKESLSASVEFAVSCAVTNDSVPAGQKPIYPSRGKLLLADIITGLGAGIYEELIFRLILICALMMLFQDVFGFSHKNSIILAVLVSAAMFSAHHHIDFLTGRQGAEFTMAKFVFRTIAGVYFAVVFAIRGFGITAGTHAFYDIIATCVNAAFFQQ
ncbi:CPBP family intramembrane glutamic endopeptidase [Planctomycetota bacterium]